MLTNFIRAKATTHGLMVAIAVIFFAAHRFFSDPQAGAWLAGHWALRDLGETIEATMLVYGVYSPPTKPMI
jgi:hypothetical protein